MQITLEQILQIVERRRLKVLGNPADPSWTEHFAELKNEIRELWSAQQPLALDTGCRCDLQDSPNAPADWHGENCPRYRPRK